MKNLIKNHKMKFYIFMLFNLLVPLINIAFAYSIKLIIDSGLSKDKQLLAGAIYFCGLVIIAYALLNFINFYLRNRLSQQVMEGYNERILRSILSKDYKGFSEENSSKFISMLTENMTKIEEDYLLQFFNISRNISLMIFSLAAMFIGNWLLTLFVILASLVPIFINAGIGKKSVAIQKNVLDSKERYLAKIKDILLGFFVIKTFNVESRISHELSNERAKLSQDQLKKEQSNALVRVISEFSGMFVFLVAFGGGMLLVFNGQTTIGSVTAIVQLVNFVVMPLNEVGIGMNKFRQGAATLDSIKLDDNEEKLSKDNTKREFTEKIEFDGVDFAYDREVGNVLSNISLTIQKGEKIAIVGLSGSGKTSLLNLLLGLYEVSSGKIKIDGENLKTLSSESIYHLMAAVQQNIYIFDNSLRYNITLNESFAEEEIERAVQDAGLSDFLAESEMKLETGCGEGGSNLSGGQRQRISIARALIRKKSILLLDEATSSLDNQTTSEVEESILDIEDLTLLVVTHKLNKNILQKYNRILFMENGKIIEDASFEDLIDKKGKFYKLCK